MRYTLAFALFTLVLLPLGGCDGTAVPLDGAVLDGAVLDGAVLDGAVLDGALRDGAVQDASGSCGNGQIDPGEECDFGAGNSDTIQDRCRLDCREAHCGDGVLDLAEACDDGPGNSDTLANACRTACELASCGDGVVDTGEACDEGGANSDTLADACRTSCETARCGDGVVDAGEACDEGAANSDTLANACRTSCQAATCGDGVVDTGETCDDGNEESGDGCRACVAENTCVLGFEVAADAPPQGLLTSRRIDPATNTFEVGAVTTVPLGPVSLGTFAVQSLAVCGHDAYALVSSTSGNASIVHVGLNSDGSLSTTSTPTDFPGAFAIACWPGSGVLHGLAPNGATFALHSFDIDAAGALGPPSVTPTSVPVPSGGLASIAPTSDGGAWVVGVEASGPYSSRVVRMRDGVSAYEEAAGATFTDQLVTAAAARSDGSLVVGLTDLMTSVCLGTMSEVAGAVTSVGSPSCITGMNFLSSVSLPSAEDFVVATSLYGDGVWATLSASGIGSLEVGPPQANLHALSPDGGYVVTAGMSTDLFRADDRSFAPLDTLAALSLGVATFGCLP